jgi:hypothetical protein
VQIVCISRGTLSGGKELAVRLAAKLGYRCLSREDLVEAATREGIHVGKLEMAMVKPGGFSERLVLEREHYLAFTTAFLCDRAVECEGLVYHGRTGHLLLPGISHVLRVRAVANRDYRIRAAMQQLGIDRERARRYVEAVDEDRRRWVRALYGVLWEDVAHYDFIISLEQINLDNAASALTAIAQLPDFQMTPASRRAMEDLRLGAKARMILARDARTYRSTFKVSAAQGTVTVTYLPQDRRLATVIPAALAPLEGVQDVRTTMATTNLLWIQERFAATSEAFQNVVEVATKWNAAVELVRFAPEEAAAEEVESRREAAVESTSEYNGGIEDDVALEEVTADGGLRATVEELARLGRSGGGRRLPGGAERLVALLDRTTSYSMVVLGDLFLTKGQAARVRMARELQALLSDHVKAPVVLAEELKVQFLFGPRDILRIAVFSAAIAAIYFSVFRNQAAVLTFLTGSGWVNHLLAAAGIFAIVPVVAYLYGTVVQSLLKLIRME